jgi:hypothetical protein
LDQKVIELETGVDVLPTLDQKVKCSCKVMWRNNLQLTYFILFYTMAFYILFILFISKFLWKNISLYNVFLNVLYTLLKMTQINSKCVANLDK